MAQVRRTDNYVVVYGQYFCKAEAGGFYCVFKQSVEFFYAFFFFVKEFFVLRVGFMGIRGYKYGQGLHSFNEFVESFLVYFC